MTLMEVPGGNQAGGEKKMGRTKEKQGKFLGTRRDAMGAREKRLFPRQKKRWEGEKQRRLDLRLPQKGKIKRVQKDLKESLK